MTDCDICGKTPHSDECPIGILHDKLDKSEISDWIHSIISGLAKGMYMIFKFSNLDIMYKFCSLYFPDYNWDVEYVLEKGYVMLHVGPGGLLLTSNSFDVKNYTERPPMESYKVVSINKKLLRHLEYKAPLLNIDQSSFLVSDLNHHINAIDAALSTGDAFKNQANRDRLMSVIHMWIKILDKRNEDDEEE